MKLSDIFDQLTHGELSQVFIGGGETQGITEENRAAIIAHINLGLTELHKRFFLKEGKVKIIPQEGRLTYLLDRKYAKSNERSTETKYIDDSERKFTDDLLKIETVLDHKGCEFPLNNKDEPFSVFTPTYNMVVLPEDHDSEYVTVVYRANHEHLDDMAAMYPPEMVDVNIPQSHLWPLLLFVASRVMNPIGINNEFHEGNNYAAKFEEACQRLEQQNYQVDTLNSNTRLERGGWV